MVIEKQAILDVVSELAANGSRYIDWGLDKHRQEYIIVDSWETISVINDAINKALAPEMWEKARPVYWAAAKREARKSLEQYAKLHPHNLATHDPFASLRTHEGRLDVVSAHGKTAPFIVPKGVLSIMEVEGLEQVFNDDHSLCGDCQIVLETEPTHHEWKRPYRIFGGGYVCLDCFGEDGQEDED